MLLAAPSGGVPRSYSAANAPRPDGTITLLVTRVPGGQLSPWLYDDLAPGDEVLLCGPYGSFIADPAGSGPVLYLAAGSGLAPIRALVEGWLAAGSPSTATLICSARTEAEVLDRERFERLHVTNPAFRFVRTLTRADGSPPLGRIPELLPDLAGDLAGHFVFIAGAPGFVGDCARAARAAGAAAARIHTEEFFAEGG